MLSHAEKKNLGTPVYEKLLREIPFFIYRFNLHNMMYFIAKNMNAIKFVHWTLSVDHKELEDVFVVLFEN